MKYLTVFFLFGFFFISKEGRTQDTAIVNGVRPYFAYLDASLSEFGVFNSDGGIGVSFGLKRKDFYAGLEFGYNGAITNTALVPSGAHYTLGEVYWGLHGGAVLSQRLFAGVVLIYSYGVIVHGAGDYSKVPSWFDLGPDLRYQALSHLMLSLAYTHRRGLNMGIGVIMW